MYVVSMRPVHYTNPYVGPLRRDILVEALNKAPT